jgi:phosphate-selective porin OprO and OprP
VSIYAAHDHHLNEENIVSSCNVLKKYLFISMTILLSFSYSPVYANNEAMLDLLKILVDKGSLTQGEYELLVNAARADGEKVEGTVNEMKADVENKTKNLPKVTTDGKIKIESADGSWAFQPIGRIFWDNVLSDDDGSGTEDSASELRRARIGFKATFMKVFKSKLELDFAKSGEAVWKDVWISYNGKNSMGKHSIKIGQQHVPLGHATISSSNYMPLMRRPLFADGPQPARKLGVTVRHDSKRWFAHTGVFREELEDDSDEIGDAGKGDESLSFAARVGGTPLYKDKKHLIHVGASFMYQKLNGDKLNFINKALVSHIGKNALEADFGTNADDLNAFDIEALAVWGPFHAVGEYIHWNIDDPDGDADLSAWSIDAGWFLTGESMKYKQGAFSGIGPRNALGKGGIGAWQMAARIENMNLNDGAIITGGDADVVTVGLNWIPVKNVRFMANYARVIDFECAPIVVQTLSTGCIAGADGKEPSAFSLRSQVYW